MTRKPAQAGRAQATLQLTTEPHLASGGDAVARHPDGRVVFVSGAAPSERVEARLTKDNKSFVRAEVVKVLEPGPSRVNPPCAHYAQCGGCTLQHVAYGEQVASKDVALRETLARIGGLDLSETAFDAPWSGAPYGYRTRARLVRALDGRLGFRARRSKHVVDIQRCPVLAPELQEVLTALRPAMEMRGPMRREGRREDEISLVFDGASVLADFPEGLTKGARTAARAAGVPLLFGNDAVTEGDDGHGPLVSSPQVFAQASRSGNQALVGYVAELCPEGAASAVDLYSGSGNFTRVLAKRAARVDAFEGARDAVALARRVAPENVKVHLSGVEQGFTSWVAEGGRAEVVLLDPPRTGTNAKVLKAIQAAEASALIFVSCDPATFARDAGILAQGGLRLARVRLFDLYPQTEHSEVVGLFVR
ncbi:MAG: class I SAM-dependent RNA methyltransferase [Myxococcales bacterium]|nr:class I SAM-dependent RNA methyltransferase [Myxococcales bacterium]